MALHYRIAVAPLLAAVLIGSTAASTAADASMPTPNGPNPRHATTCHPSHKPVVVANGTARISVRTVGHGAPVLMIPSLGRGASDFDDLAAGLARQGWMAVLPDPRGIGNSTGPAPTGLGDLADDVSAVIAARCRGPVNVVGHAFGQRVARMLATRHPEQVRQVVILAAGGRVPLPATIRASILTAVSEGTVPDAQRLVALQGVFFAQGQDASQWLTGWTPAAALAQSAATSATNIDDWWGGGSAPILAVQGKEDPIAPPANGLALAAQYGDRIRVVELAHASHAILPEQPAAVSTVVARYLDGERDQTLLQAAIDAKIVEPTG